MRLMGKCILTEGLWPVKTHGLAGRHEDEKSVNHRVGKESQETLVAWMCTVRISNNKSLEDPERRYLS